MERDLGLFARRLQYGFYFHGRGCIFQVWLWDVFQVLLWGYIHLKLFFFFTFVPFEILLITIIAKFEALMFFHQFLGKLFDSQWLRGRGVGEVAKGGQCG